MNKIIFGDCRDSMRDMIAQGVKVQMCVTSPPYFGLRSYGIGAENGEIGLEQTPDEYVAAMVEVFSLVWYLLADDGVIWVNLGDSYSGAGPSGSSYQSETTKRRAELSTDGAFRVSKTLAARGLTYSDKKPVAQPGMKKKDLIGIPWLLAFALRADGWYLRQDIIWHKPNPMPESVTDRCTKAHEYLFLLAKSERYYFDNEAIKEPAVSAGQDRGGSKAYVAEYEKTGDQRLRTKAGLCSIGVTADMRNKRSVWTVPTVPFSGWTETSHLSHVAAGELSDGMTHRVFADCPVHGHLHPLNDGRVGGESIRTARTCNCLAQGKVFADSSNSTHHGEQNQRCMSDCSGQSCSPSAIDHSSQTSRTDHDHQTSLHGSAFDQRDSRTPNTQHLLAICGLADHKNGNSIFEDVLDDSQNSQIHHHSVDKPISQALCGTSVDSLNNEGCICQFYQKTTKKTSHFATFPPALIEPCILAGSRVGDVVLDPFMGSGTTAQVAIKLGRQYLGCELNPAYADLQNDRTAQDAFVF